MGVEIGQTARVAYRPMKKRAGGKAAASAKRSGSDAPANWVVQACDAYAANAGFDPRNAASRLAEHLGVSVRAVYNWRTWGYVPRGSYAAELARLSGVQVERLTALDPRNR